MLLMLLNSRGEKPNDETFGRIVAGKFTNFPPQPSFEIGHEGSISSDLKLMRLLPHQNIAYVLQA